MRSGIVILALLMLALIALPLVPPADGAAPGVPSADVRGGGHAYRYGATTADPMSHARAGMMQGERGPVPGTPGARHCQPPPEETQFRQELRRDPFDWNMTPRTIRLRGYRRLSGKNILDHEKRHLIYTTILANPGIGIPALASLTGINLHTLRYHLGHLMQLGKIACLEQGGSCHLFENHGRYDRAAQQEILYRRYPTTGRILSLVAARPGITRGEIAREMNLAGPSVTRWTHRLVAEGVVSMVRDGRQVHYFPVDCPDYRTGGEHTGQPA